MVGEVPAFNHLTTTGVPLSKALNSQNFALLTQCEAASHLTLNKGKCLSCKANFRKQDKYSMRCKILGNSLKNGGFLLYTYKM